ncbi:MAG: hypothetical protein Q7R22_011405 [Verrucomicrobiota bacterium JB025]|nr:hypothetical protein [Verrucomicrobiota bacterium JB025]
MKSIQSRTESPTIKTRVSRTGLRTFEFYAKQYDIPVPLLLASEFYNNAVVLADDVFGQLEWIDSSVSEEDMVPVELEIFPDAYALLERISQLLRRPLEELAEGLLRCKAGVFAEDIAEALNNEEWPGVDMDYSADCAIEFQRHAKRNQAPGWGSSRTGWVACNLHRQTSIQAAREEEATI